MLHGKRRERRREFIYKKNPGYILHSYIYKKWDFIHYTRLYIYNIIRNLFNDLSCAEKVSSAAYELIENAYKYSPAQSDICIILRMLKNRFIVQIKNYTVGDAEKVYQVIKAEIKKVYANPDPGTAFKEKILESLNDPGGRSRLGMAKIRLETGAKLFVKLEENGLITMTASFFNK